MKYIIETERLFLRKFLLKDAVFTKKLVNQPSWIKNIGERNVKTIKDAENYIKNGPIKSYKTNGYGFYLVAIKETNESIGLCGLIKRQTLENTDIGFAFLDHYTSKGFGYEAAKAIISYGFSNFDIEKIDAVVNPDNQKSIGLIKKLGLVFEKMILFDAEQNEICLFGLKKTS
jgi:[ribosomal protein S5]-alanine N-acetyltransferase